MDLRLEACFAFVKDNRRREVTREERLDIFRLHAWFRSQGVAAASKTVAQALGRSMHVVQDVWREYQQSQTVTALAPPANHYAHITTVPRTKRVAEMVQAFVRDRRSTRTRTTATDVSNYLREMSILEYEPNDKKEFAAALRSVQRYLRAQGYKRGNRKGSSTYHLSKANALARDVYVRKMQALVDAPDGPHVVYTDESYIHHHYKSHHQALYDPSDTMDLPLKEKHKGRCYCFVAAILDSPTLESKVMAIDIFTGGKSTAKQPKDYHGMFDTEYYVAWFGRLLDEMDEGGITNALIVLDNAKYHKSLPKTTPTSGRRKGVLVDACRAYGIPTSGHEHKSELWGLLATHIRAHVKPIITDMAESRGHSIVFTPPHHSDLQPIEIVWAIVKGEVGRQYTDMTKFPDVKLRLEAAFANLKPSTIKGCVRSAQEKLQLLHNHLVQVDALESESSSAASGNSSDDGSDSDD
ncbi:hypothetical protein DYB35_009172 [Aphanomyces astaci]|uniref:Tc1-like transposase DDE domain-containing protein n=1 Tax=Aphanomyces astaci TaxID=112090 RepID=A0A418DB63_APHAT|nr:hypothetical protein DYB35_009172 [Aphanomyces astaci]